MKTLSAAILLVFLLLLSCEPSSGGANSDTSEDPQTESISPPAGCHTLVEVYEIKNGEKSLASSENWDKDGNVLRSVSNFSGDASRMEYSYNDEGEMTQSDYFKNDVLESSSMQIFENGKLQEIRDRFSDSLEGSFSAITKFNYDKQGNETGRLQYGAEGELEENINIVYTYDEAGRWISKEILKETNGDLERESLVERN